MELALILCLFYFLSDSNKYKYVTEYVIGNLNYNEMVRQLEIAIHQFAKRHMTWFRGMERRGTLIHWVDAMLPMEEKVKRVEEIYQAATTMVQEKK